MELLMKFYLELLNEFLGELLEESPVGGNSKRISSRISTGILGSIAAVIASGTPKQFLGGTHREISDATNIGMFSETPR